MTVMHVDSDILRPSPFGKEPVLSVELHTAANPLVIPTIRTVAADLASRADFDLDSIDDLRMAVDDVCAMLVRIAAVDAALSCRFTLWAARIEVATEVEADHSTQPLPIGSFDWWVLESLADEVDSIFFPGAPNTDESNLGGRVGVTLAKSAFTAPPR